MFTVPSDNFLIQVHHVRAELDVMSEADDNNEWVVKLHYSFQVWITRCRPHL